MAGRHWQRNDPSSCNCDQPGNPEAELVTFQADSNHDVVAKVKSDVADAVVTETARSDTEQNDDGNASGIVEQPMTVRIESPELLDVTLVDLPGIKYDTEQAGTRIKRLVKRYIKTSSANILVVHNAVVDTDTKESFEMAKEQDPDGRRTLCVLTHVDTITDV